MTELVEQIQIQAILLEKSGHQEIPQEINMLKNGISSNQSMFKEMRQNVGFCDRNLSSVNPRQNQRNWSSSVITNTK